MLSIAELSETISQDYTNTVVNDSELAEIDPALMLLIAEIVMQVIQLWQDCENEPEKAADQARKPSLYQRLMLRRIVQRTIGNKLFRRSGDELVSSILNSGKNLTAENVQGFYEELDN